MKILVTGADGFIGSHLTELLVRENHTVTAMALYNSFDTRGWLDSIDPKILKELKIVSGDIRDPHFVRNAMTGCEGVLNLAALIAIPFSYVAPESYVTTNVTGALNVVQAARDLGVAKVVQVSTSEVYGSAQFVPITEEHPLVGQSPYSATKIGADQIAMSYFRAFGTPVTIARPFNTYGPRQSTRAVIPTIITQIAAGQRRIELGALRPTRDFNFVSDTARGMMASLQSEKSIGEVINFGSGFEISVGDTVSLIAETMGVEVEVVEREERQRPAASEVERLHASNAKAKRLLDWSPEFGGRDGFKKGLAKTAAWFSDPANLARYRVGSYTL
ncbi:SDR family NAD(P)-dependent oxidoreductase [Bradyrhizobium sp. AUGA SZCCT0158]|uniref:NAD-dependent 4,6-dehydratase LegB n=1 Tax=Bradyrhizobium sp. AUGA SZCCT0158 TaxID=2807661 RepID=UPI001BA6CE0B|nr:NAD-dependent 4,6-dehydratase LegB [Bradyrhizobium sp. AUGA SZCCT0158]MBR1199484.1 SDR family NAD(P)-dependent oxidoreductase [Bradyrhizobium sp. AUGA SZCCT0158]